MEAETKEIPHRAYMQTVNTPKKVREGLECLLDVLLQGEEVPGARILEILGVGRE